MSHIKCIHNNETRTQISMCFILHLVRSVQHGLCCYAYRSTPKQNGSRLGRLVRLAKWIAEKRKQQRSGHLLMLFLCGRVIEGKREVTNR